MEGNDDVLPPPRPAEVTERKLKALVKARRALALKRKQQQQQQKKKPAQKPAPRGRPPVLSTPAGRMALTRRTLEEEAIGLENRARAIRRVLETL